jgi:hypothetical protein
MREKGTKRPHHLSLILWGPYTPEHDSPTEYWPYLYLGPIGGSITFRLAAVVLT